MLALRYALARTILPRCYHIATHDERHRLRPAHPPRLKPRLDPVTRYLAGSAVIAACIVGAAALACA